MKPKAHILIVEDEPILYRRLRNILKKENYSIDKFTVSVAEAIKHINLKTPDLVLLDIQLEGKLTGVDLGRILNNQYKIPFIYVTELDDNQTFYQGLETQHEQFIVKTKPTINEKEIVRAVQTVLNKHKKNTVPIIKKNIEVLPDYLEEIQKYSKDKITRVVIPYKKIVFFSTDFFEDKNGNKKRVRENYISILTNLNSGDYYFLKNSLNNLEKILPDYFVRINQGYIVNILPEILKGRINKHNILIKNQKFKITYTYFKPFEKCYKKYYQT